MPRRDGGDDLFKRAWREGLDRLRTTELVALVTGSGAPGPRAVRAAARAVERLGGLRRTSVATLDECAARGLLSSRASLALCAAFALGRRVSERPWQRGTPYTSPAEVFR